MKTYTVTGESVSRGMRIFGGHTNPNASNGVIELGGGSASKKVVMFRKNAPVLNDREFVRYHNGWPSVNDAHPVKTSIGWTLAKPNKEDDRILVLIKTRNDLFAEVSLRPGRWSFQETWLSESHEQVLVATTGPMNYDHCPQVSPNNVGWRDALITMKVGDTIIVTDQQSKTTTAKYVSIELGLVKQ